MEAFDNSFNDYALLTYLVQDSMKIIYNESLEIIKEKILNILKVLNIIDKNVNITNFSNNNKIQNENKEKSELNIKEKKTNMNNKENKLNNSKNQDKIERENLDYDKFLCKFRPILQEYFSIIFQVNITEFNNNIKLKIKSIIEKDENFKDFSEEKLKLIEDDINSKSFQDFALSSLKLCLYMHLHEPKLTFNLPSSYEEGIIKRKLIFYFYKKDEFNNIEGFPKEKCCCVVILPFPILRNNYSYQGIKPAVYIVGDPSKDILQYCELNNGDKEKEKEKEKENKIDDKTDSEKVTVILNEKSQEINKSSDKKENCMDNKNSSKSIIEDSNLNNYEYSKELKLSRSDKKKNKLEEKDIVEEKSMIIRKIIKIILY